MFIHRTGKSLQYCNTYSLFPRFFPVPASVTSFQCEPVAKQSFLMIKWACPSGNNSGFKIKIRNDTWEKEEQAPSCKREGSEETYSTMPLDYFSTYNVTIATLSSSSESLPVQRMCTTSITGKHEDLRMKDVHRTKILTSWLWNTKCSMLSAYRSLIKHHIRAKSDVMHNKYSLYEERQYYSIFLFGKLFFISH